jgi:hypothetical protein
LVGAAFAYTVREQYHVAWLLLRATAQCEYYTANGWLPAENFRLWTALAIGSLAGAAVSLGRVKTLRAMEWLGATAGFTAAMFGPLPHGVVE